MLENDAVARAVGAGGTKSVTIAGKECFARPIGLKELAEIQREALDFYRDQYLRAFSSGAKYLQNGQEVLQRKIEEVSRWGMDDLPKKQAYDSSRLVSNTSIQARLKEIFETDVPIDASPRMTASALDQELLKPEEYEALTGKKPVSIRIPYDSWWVTGCYEGMLVFVWKCFSTYGVTKEQVGEALGGNLRKTLRNQP